MRKKAIALMLCAALMAALAGCGRPQTEPDSRVSGNDQGISEMPQKDPESVPVLAELPDPPRDVQANYPILARSFSDAESESMANHNAKRCALLVVNYYYCRCLYSDGSCSLVRYEIIDNNLRHRTKLISDCPADYLSEFDGRLYYLNADGFPESIETDGTGRRIELDAACQSLQREGDALYCLLSDGTLLALRGDRREALIGNCSWAFVSEQGVFYTSASDGKLHLLDPEARTDVTLTSEAASSPMLIGEKLFFVSDEPDGRHICALNLSDGTQQRMADAFRGEAEYYRGWDGSWQMRLTSLGGSAGQQMVSCSEAFAVSPSMGGSMPGDWIRRCRGVDDVVRTDELFSADGTPLGFELVLPGGGSYPSLAADNEPEK